MLKINKRTKSIIVAIIILFQIASITNAYAPSAGPSKIDAVLVLDSSGSMKFSDPKGISIEAVKMFIDMCSIEGDKIGIIAYNDSIIAEKQLTEIKSSKDKQSLKDMAASIPRKSDTDIGLALRRAAEMLDKNRDDAHKPMIILFSDGRTDLGKSKRTLSQSEADKKEALRIAQYKGYPIYTIGLNVDGSVDKDELKSLSESTKAKDFITDRAEDLPQILSEIFADHLKLKIVSPGYFTGTGSFEDIKIPIPDSNVVEANISMLSQSPVELKLYDNNGKERDINSDGIYYATSSKYSMLKILNPEKGEWLLKVKGISGDKIKINLIFNYDIDIIMELDPGKDMHAGDSVNVSCHMSSGGQPVSDPEIYKSSKAKLIVTNIDKASDQEIDLKNEGLNFSGAYTFSEEGKYELKARIETESFFKESEAVIIDIQNRAPIILKDPGNQKVFLNRTKEIDLSKIFSDPDNDAMTYTVVNEKPDIAQASINGNFLNITGKEKGKTQFSITADDGKGENISLSFTLESAALLPYILLGVGGFLAIAFAIIGIPIIKRANKILPGQVMLEIKDDNTGKSAPPQYRRLDNYKGKVSLHHLLQLLPEYKETEKIIFEAGKNDSLILKNRSSCTIQKSGRIIDAGKGYQIRINDRIIINLENTSKSIALEYYL